jgi:hypothetical protein
MVLERARCWLRLEPQGVAWGAIKRRAGRGWRGFLSGRDGHRHSGGPHESSSAAAALCDGVPVPMLASVRTEVAARGWWTCTAALRCRRPYKCRHPRSRALPVVAPVSGACQSNAQPVHPASGMHNTTPAADQAGAGQLRRGQRLCGRRVVHPSAPSLQSSALPATHHIECTASHASHQHSPVKQ